MGKKKVETYSKDAVLPREVRHHAQVLESLEIVGFLWEILNSYEPFEKTQIPLNLLF